MWRRLACWFGLLVLSLLGVLALAVFTSVESELVRNRLLLLIFGLGAFGITLVILLSANLTRQFRRPVRELVAAVDRVGQEGIGPRVVAGGDGELVELTHRFNASSEQLAARIARLEEERQQLRTVLSGMVEGVVALDSEQRILYANNRAEELLEFPAVSAVGRPLWQIIRHRPLLDAVRAAQDRAEPYREEFNWNGNQTRSLTIHAARLPGSPPRGTVLVLHDTTDLRRLERLRQEFVANVSHELKTPLSVIKVYAETLLDGAVEDEANRGRFLEQIVRQSDRLHALILDLLSLARLDAGNELFDFEAVSLDSAIQGCVERHRPRAGTRNQQLTVEPPGQPVTAWADEEALAQILDNLLDNALKYTPEGGQITVRWGTTAGQAWFEVADTGIGIPEADLPRIFERFYRVDRARSRELGGTGLGLSIVKHLVGALHGTVRATSQVSNGTTFTVSLPVARAG